MSVEHNKALAQRFWDEVVNQNRLDVLDEIIVEDYVQHQGDVPPGRAGLKLFMQAMAAAFPDQQATIEDILSEGDRVMTRTRIQGTHTGPLRNLPASHKRVSVTIVDIWRVADGRFVEHWGILDNLDLMQQLGVTAGRPPA